MLFVAGTMTAAGGVPLASNLLNNKEKVSSSKLTNGEGIAISLTDDTNCRIYELEFEQDTVWNNWRTPKSGSSFKLLDKGNKNKFLEGIKASDFSNAFSFKSIIKSACKSKAEKRNANGNVYYFKSKDKKNLIYSTTWNEWDWIKDGKGQRLDS